MFSESPEPKARTLKKNYCIIVILQSGAAKEIYSYTLK